MASKPGFGAALGVDKKSRDRDNERMLILAKRGAIDSMFGFSAGRNDKSRLLAVFAALFRFIKHAPRRHPPTKPEFVDLDHCPEQPCAYFWIVYGNFDTTQGDPRC